MGDKVYFQRILGIRFCLGQAREVVDEIVNNGGLVVVPAAPALRQIVTDISYRESLLGADYSIADSTLMVLIWSLINRRRIPKLSGLKYLRILIERPDFRAPGASYWVMPSHRSAELGLEWLHESGINVSGDDTYVAPRYEENVVDSALLDQIALKQPRHIVVGVGGGTQEKLGLYLKRNLSYRPVIHCVGAAVGFLSGDQVYIPAWADNLGLGWMWRCVSAPERFVSRYWGARKLVSLLIRYRDRLPDSQASLWNKAK